MATEGLGVGLANVVPVLCACDHWVADQAEWHPRIQGRKTADVSRGDGQLILAPDHRLTAVTASADSGRSHDGRIPTDLRPVSSIHDRKAAATDGIR
jgi:hypothetical protein